MSTIHQRRRQEFMQRMDGGVAIIPAAPERVYSHDLLYPYRPDTALRYLTGYLEPEAVAVLRPGSDAPFVLFVRERDAEAETWYGTRGGIAGALEVFGADEAHGIDDLADQLPELLANQHTLYYRLGYYAHDSAVLGALDQLRGKMRLGLYPPRRIHDPGLLLDEMRLRKHDPEEIAALTRACQVTSEAHIETMRALRGATNEAQLHATFEAAIRSRGASGPSFNTIVGGGANACILHYDENRAPLVPGELVLVDAGAEVDGWCGDITRTYPVSGTFTKPQAELYELVLEAQEAALAAGKPGTTLDDIMALSVRVLAEGLVRLGFFDTDADEVIESLAYKAYFMHRVSHWLGMDTHDVGDYHVDGAARVLEAGMAYTVEPGLYIAPGASCPERYHGIGIRIEDDVLLTDTGSTILTDVPKRIDELEALLKE